MLSEEDRALIELGGWLRARGYRFVTSTPASHARVLARPGGDDGRTIEDVLGWSKRFRIGALPELERWLAASGMLRRDGAYARSAVRCSTLDGDGDEPMLVVHSAFPTVAADAVFFGPDTYRFAAAIERHLRPAHRLVDIGAGTGAGGLIARARASHVVLADINPHALRFARINAAIAGATVALITSDVLAGVPGDLDAVIANPPYLADAQHRTYRDGGGALGFDLSLRIVRESLARLAPGGQLLLYTGSPVIAGEHPLRAAIAPLLASRPCRARWRELDPDVFGEELAAAPYDRADRIAVVLLTVDVA